MAVTTEQLLTHPRAFGLVTASPVQRAICRAADGLPLGDLATHPDVIEVFGGEDAVANLPREKPKEVIVVAAIRCGKSLFAAALALKNALTIDLGFLDPAEIARVCCVSLDKDKAAIIMQHLMGALERDGGALNRYLVKKPKPTAERVRIRRDDGRVVEIVISAGKRGGGSLVSRWVCTVIFDEAGRMNGAEDGVVNYEDMRNAVITRLSLLKGAQSIAITSPWAAAGPIYDAVQNYNASPTRFLVLVRATGPQLNPILWTPDAVEEARQNDEAAFITDVLGEFADVASGLFLASDLQKATRAEPLSRLREDGWYYTAAMDPGLRGNSWTLCVVGFRPSDTGDSSDDRFHVATCRQWTGSRKDPLKARDVLPAIANELAPYGISEVHTDQWGADLFAEIAEDSDLTVTQDADSTAEKDARWLDFRTRVISGQVELSPDPVLRADLLSARKRLTSNGCKIELPLTRDGRHADYAPAVVLAVAKAASGPSWVYAVKAWRANGAVSPAAPIYPT